MNFVMAAAEVNSHVKTDNDDDDDELITTSGNAGKFLKISARNTLIE